MNLDDVDAVVMTSLHTPERVLLILVHDTHLVHRQEATLGYRPGARLLVSRFDGRKGYCRSVATIGGLFGCRILVLGVLGKAPGDQCLRILLTHRLGNIRLSYFLELELDASVLNSTQQIPVMVQ